jgi:PAS domain S-box-containing protein
MVPFRDLPIKRKLTLITVAISGAALLLACAAFALHEQRQLRKTMSRDFAILADMFDANVASGLAFNDAVSIQQTLGTLGANRHIVAAGVYDLRGEIVARYVRDGGGVPFAFPGVSATGQRFENGRLDTFKDIVLTGEKIGSVYIASDLEELRERAWGYAITAIGLLLICSLVAWLLAARLQKLISQPLVELARTTAAVAAGKTYSVRAVKTGNDELGALIDSFNGMLSEIETRDRALQASHGTLEKRVEERTAELARSLSLLNATLNSTPDGLVAIDLSGRQICQNSKFITMWSFPPELVLGAVPGARVKFVASQLKDADAYLQIFAQMLADPDTERFDLLELKDGRIVERYVHPQQVDGKTVGLVISFRDVTARRRAEAALAETSALLETLLENTPDLIYFKDLQSRFVRYSRVFSKRVALAENNGLVGRTDFDIYTPEHAQPAFDDEQEIIRTGQPMVGKMEKETYADGSVTWSLASKMPWRDGQGKIIGTFGISKEATELKKAEDQLANSLSVLQATLDSTADGILVVGLDLKVVTHNRKFADMWRMPADVLARADGRAVIAIAETQLKNPEAFRETLQADRDHPELVGTSILEFTDGRVFERYSQPHRVNGVVVGRVLCYRDITERQRAERELRAKTALLEAQLDSSIDGILVVDNEGKKVLQNQRTIDLWKIPPEIAGEKDDEKQIRFVVSRTKEPEKFVEKVRYLYAHPLESSRDEIEFKDGMVLDRYSAPVIAKDGTHYGRIWAFRDITDRKQAEAELARVHRQLLETSRQAGMAEVATGVLHNVGNVLNSVNVSTTLIGDLARRSKIDRVAKLRDLFDEHQNALGAFFEHDPRGRQVPAFLRTLAEHLANEQAEQLKELESLRKNVEHIKDIVAMQQNYAKVSGISETIVVTELIEDALRMNSGALTRHEVALIRDFQVQPTLTTDKHKVLQILVNLMRNAKYACDESGRTDKQIIVRVTTAAGRVRIAVIDNGVGIAPGNLTRIFAHGFTTRKTGHGFGLHSGALAAKELGGAIVVHSDGPGQGATFTLELPLVAAGTNGAVIALSPATAGGPAVERESQTAAAADAPLAP